MNTNALYAGLLRVPDRPTQDVLRQQADAISALGQAIQTLNGRPQPKVPAFNEIKAALQANGVAPLVITGLPGVATSATYGTHATRPVATAQPEGSFYFETDRGWLYINEALSSGRVWAYVAGTMTGVIASRPADLGTNDTNARFYATDQQQLYRWSGSLWLAEADTGVLIVGTHGQRLTAAFGSWRYAVGAQFYETDRTLYYAAADASGLVNTNGTALTWGGGDLFKVYQVGAPITVNGVATTITAFGGTTSVTVADNLGVHLAVAYTITAGKWIWYAGIWFDTYANRPVSSGVFGVDDIGALFYATDYTHLFQWQYDDPTTPTFRWRVVFGLMRGTFAQRPAGLSAADVFSDNGFLFFATDRNHTWRWNSFSSVTPTTAYWDVRPEFSYPAIGVIASITAGLTVHDVGYRYYATDFNREYAWQGAAWLDSPGQPTRGFVQPFLQAPDPAAGWHVCDGTAGVTISKSDGTTTTITLPDYTTSSYLKLVKTANTVGPTAASGATANTTATENSAVTGLTLDAHTTAADTTVTGAGTRLTGPTAHTVTDPGHTHTQNAHSHAPGTVELQRTELLAYVRL